MRKVLVLAAALHGALSLVSGAAWAGGSIGHQAWTSTSAVGTFTPTPGLIYVAQGPSGREAMALVAVIDASALPDPAVLELEEGERFGVSELSLVACSLAGELNGDGQIPPDRAPAPDCSTTVAVERTGSGWRVPLRALRVAYGVAILPAPTSASVWRVGFKASSTKLGGVESGSAAPTVSAGPSAKAGGPVSQPLAPRAPVPSLPGTMPAPVTDEAGTTPTTIAVDEVQALEEDLGGAPLRSSSASSPAAIGSAPVLVLAFGTAAVAVGGLVLRRRRGTDVPAAGRGRAVGLRVFAAGAFVAAPPLLLGESDIFRLGNVMIVAVAAIGLHVLVSWAGEISLAHAATVGLPAFAVAKVAADHAVNPLLLLPFGMIVGVVTGLVIGLPSLRARGLQVALVTLAAGVAIERFLYTKAWLVGPPGGVAVPVPSLGPIALSSSRALYPVIATVATASVLAARMLHGSKVGRAFAWTRDRPEAAMAFAIPVVSYRLAAYALAGAYAGLAGGLTAAWVQRLTPGAFPFTISFTYMVMVVLAGRGFIWGVVASVALLEGGRVFASGTGPLIAYAGPVLLIVVLTRYRAGLNGIGRQLMQSIHSVSTSSEVEPATSQPGPGRPTFVAIGGAVAVTAGLLAIGVAWYQAGNTDQVWVQNQLIMSGGIGGLALAILGGIALAVERVTRTLERRP